MVQVLPQLSRTAQTNEQISQGLGAGLQALIGQKIEKRQQAEQLKQQTQLAKAYEEAGLNPQYAFLPEKIQQEIFRNQRAQEKTELYRELLSSGASLTGAPEEEGLNILALASLDPQLAGVALNLQKEKRTERKEALAETAKFREEVETQGSKAREQQLAIKDLESAIRSGEVGRTSKANFAESLDTENVPFLKFVPGIGALKKALVTPNAAKFKAATKSIMSGAKEIFGARITNYDAQLFQEMLPQIGRSEAANLASLKVIKDLADARQEKAKILAQVKEESPDKPRKDLQEEVNRRYDAYLDQKHREIVETLENLKESSSSSPEEGTVEVLLPDGRRGSIPAHNLDKALEMGAKRA